MTLINYPNLKKSMINSINLFTLKKPLFQVWKSQYTANAYHTKKKHGRVCSWEWRKRSWRNFKKKIKFQETNRLKVKVLVAHEWSWHSKHGRQGSDIGKFSSESVLSISSHYWQRMTKHNVESAIERFLVYIAIFISIQRFDFSKSQQSTTSSSRYQHWRAQTGTWR